MIVVDSMGHKLSDIVLSKSMNLQTVWCKVIPEKLILIQQ